MGFIKIATVHSMGTAVLEGDGLRKIASSDGAASGAKSPNRSYYIDGARKLDIRGMLQEAASKFDISSDPSDYIFEAIRANTTNVPNENHDGFHRNELLRFDTKLAKPVYLTYVGKPHHLNHKTDDPKRARGVILDAYYNDVTPAMESCPMCASVTKDESARDSSGIHCAKCGCPVKDEFVEILVAVDTQKDPTLAKGIKEGILNAGSMGCNCASTVCNVCEHVAKSTHDFCAHIRGAAKGTLWERQGNKFVRTTPDRVKATLRSASYKVAFDGNQLVGVSLTIPERNYEVRKAFEYCQGVEFDEYSRVHKPADPKARTVEILKAAQASDPTLTLSQETEALIRRARLARLEASMAKTAATQTFYAVRVNGNDEDLHVAATLAEATKVAEVGRRDVAEYFTLTAPSLRTAMMHAIRATLDKTAQYEPVAPKAGIPVAGDVNLVVPDGVKVYLEDENSVLGTPEAPGASEVPGAPGAIPPVPGVEPPATSIEDLTEQELAPEDEQQSPEEFGMLPPGASAPLEDRSAEDDSSEEDEDDEESEEAVEQKYASVYGDFEVEVFADRAVMRSPGGDVFSVKTATALKSDSDKRAFGSSLVESVLSDGLVRTALKFKGSFDKRIADSTEGAMWNLAGGRPDVAGGALAGAMEPAKEVHKEPKKVVESGGATDDVVFADKGDRPVPANSLESRNTNLDSDVASVASPSDSALDGAEEAAKEKHPEVTMTDDALSGAESNMKVKMASKAAVERATKLYAARIEKMKADHAAELEVTKTAEREKIFRALRIAQRRAALNLETSPLKATVVDSLTVPRSLGRSASTGNEMEYGGLDEGLALHLVEAAWANASSEEVETLIQRAAEFLEYDDKYLVSAERDLSKQAAVIPPVSNESQLEPLDDVQRRAASLREEVSRGNLHLAPGTTDAGVVEDKATAIRDALSPTRVGRLFGDFKPSAS